MKLLKYLKKIKNFSVLIIPDDTSRETRSIKLDIFRLLILAFVFSTIIAVSGYYVFNLTGLGEKYLPGSYIQNAEEKENIKKLNEKIIFIARELQELKSTNERLKYAIVLGDSTLADSFKVTRDSLENIYKTPKEGSLLGVIFESIFNQFNWQDNSIFFLLPVNGYISRGFDPEKGHHGIDIVAKDGTPVYAAAGGFVVFSTYTNDYGHVVILSHSDGYLSFYKHCSVILKKEREFVKQGEMIAKSGNSGLATTGPHLHFEIWHNGKAVDPESLIINNK